MTRRAEAAPEDVAAPGTAEAPAGGDAPPAAPPAWAARVLLTLIHAYRGLRQGRPSPCRFVPSCSAYGLEAVTRHGAARGTWLTVRRLTRCRPFGGSGLDPVPD